MKNKLNSYQKVMNAINGNPMENPPLALTLSLYSSKLISCPTKTFYTNAEFYVKGQDAIVDLYDTDIVTTPFVFVNEGEVYGSKILYKEKTPPQLKKPAISSHTEIKNLKIPAYNAGSKAYCLEAASILVSKYKHKKYIVGNTLSCVDACTMIMGVEGFLDVLLFHPVEAKHLMEIVSVHFIEYTNALFDIGVDAVVIPSTLCSPTFLTNKIIEELTLPALQNAFKEIKGPVIMHHGGAKNLKNLHYFIDLPNLAGFVIDDHESLVIARQIVGNKLLLGNMNIYQIAYKTPEIIKNKCIDILNNMQNDNNFIFLNSGPDIFYETPHENIATIFETVRNFRRHET